MVLSTEDGILSKSVLRSKLLKFLFEILKVSDFSTRLCLVKDLMLGSRLIYNVQFFCPLRAGEVPYGNKFSRVQNFTILRICKLSAKINIRET